MGLGISIIAVKLGEKGCYVTDGKEEYFIEAFRVKVEDTTGAGDAFDAGFLYGLLKGKDLYDCGRLGNFVASRCIASMGARTGLPRLSELKEAGFYNLRSKYSITDSKINFPSAYSGTLSNRVQSGSCQP